jgi:hypothetical protein
MLNLNLIILIFIVFILLSYTYKFINLESFKNEPIGPLVAIFKNSKDNNVKFLNFDDIPFVFEIEETNFKNIEIYKYYMLYKIPETEKYRVELHELKKK